MKFITLLKNPSISRLALCLILFFGIADGISKGVTSYQAQTTATHASGAASALSLSFPSNTVAGDVILVGFDFDKNASLSSLSDAQGNTFTEVGTPLMSPGGAQSRVYYARNIRGGADTVTVKLTANSAYIEVYLSEYLGMNKTSPVDAQAGAVGSAGNVSSGLATTIVGDVIYGFSVGDGASTVGSSFTARSTMNGNLVEDKITGFTGPHDATAIANSGWTMQMVSLKPASTNPVANLSATSLNFAGQAVGTTSGVQKITLTNSGNAALIITSIALSGANAGDFTQTNNCGSSLAAAANCAISVTFKPAATGTRTAAVILTDNATGGTQSVILTGAGTSTTTANVSPSGLIFANQTLGATSAAQIATLTNSGTAALGITSIALSGANASDFKQSNNCSSNVAAGAKCTISFTFTPSASGTRVALLTIIDTAPGSPQTVSLSGTGAGPTPTVSVTPSSLSFGSQCVAMTSTVQTVSVKNTGTSTLNVTKLAVTGVNASEFAQTSTCGASVAAGASCTIAVLFTPSATGARAAALSISDNASGGSQTVSLSGSGSHNVMVSWDDSTSSGVVGYYVYRGTTSGAEGSTPVNGTLTNCNSYMDENVTAGAKYYYIVKSLGADGVTRSAASSETQATVPTL